MSLRETLILLPGLYADEALWAAQRDGLADVADVQVADLSQDDSIAAMAGRVLACAPERFALAGLSMGGYVALEIWRHAPERVTRLALFDTNARPDSAEHTANRREAIARAVDRSFETVVREALPRLMHPEAPPQVQEAFVAMALRVGLTVYIRQQEAIINRADSRPCLPTLAVPTLVAVGEDDLLTPPELAQEMAALIPGARLEKIARCGHLSSIEQPEAVTALLREWICA